MMNLIIKIFNILLLIKSTNLLLIDDDCYQYYSIFGIHINNMKIELCQEVELVHLPKEATSRFVFYVEDKNKTQILVSIVDRYDDGLMNKSTPIFTFWTDRRFNRSNNEAKVTFVNELVPDLADFSFYHNPSKKIALVLFYYGSFSVVEGVIGDYTLRFIERTQKYIWMKLNYAYERIPINWQNLGAPEIKDLELSDFNLNSHLDAVNISIDVIFDSLSIQEKSPLEVIKSLLIYFNAINMLYANFTSPKIQIVIKLLSLPITIYNTSHKPYEPIDFIESQENPLSKPIVLFYMMITPICQNNDSKMCLGHSKIKNQRLYCDENNPLKVSPSFYHIRHMDLQHSYSKAAQMLALSFNASLLHYTDECSGIMNDYQDPPDLPLTWSKCTINKLSNYFRSVNASCFREINFLDI